MNKLTLLAIYLIGLSIALNYAFTYDFTAASDTALEYSIYMLAIENGGRWTFLMDNMLISCLMTTLFPAWLQLLSKIEPLTLFIWYECLIIAVLPVLVYQLAQKYILKRYALLAPAFVMAQMYFLHAPSYARINIAVAFFVALLLVILSDSMSKKLRLPLLIVLSTGLIFSHYGVAIISTAMLAATCILVPLLRKGKLSTATVLLATTALVLITSGFIWYGLITKAPLKYANRTIINAAQLERLTKLYTEKGPNRPGTRPVYEAVEVGFFSLDTREPVIQVAFGKTWPHMNIAQKTEFVFSWLTVIGLSLGLLLLALYYRCCGFPLELVAMMAIGYGLILLTIAVPYLSHSYGIARVYYHVATVLSLCFVVGTTTISKFLGMKLYIVPIAIYIPFALCTSGIMHQFFGLTRG